MKDSNDKPVLAFDCSTPVGSVALACGDVSHERTLEPGTHATLLVPMIEEVMQQAGVRYTDLDCIVTTVGPGSFTGVRIGLATLHGLALAHNLPVKITTSLQAMAYHFAMPNYAVALHAGKGQHCLQEFEGVTPVSTIQLVEPSVIENRLDCYGSHRDPDGFVFLSGPQAWKLAAIAPLLPVTPLAEAVPIYIRPADAKVSAPPPWLPGPA